MRLLSLLLLLTLAGAVVGCGGEDIVKNEVFVVGTIHDDHLTSARYGLVVLTRLIRQIDPDYVLADIPAGRFDTAWRQFVLGDSVAEPRVGGFPEYVDVVFPLQRELGFEIIPASGWTQEIADARRDTLKAISEDPARREEWDEYMDAMSGLDTTIVAGGAADDPFWIHSDAYDEAVATAFAVYERLFGDELGAGGWERANDAHYRNIELALTAHQGEGKRFVVLCGVYHKGWFLKRLRQREDIVLVDVTPLLDRVAPRIPRVEPER